MSTSTSLGRAHRELVSARVTGPIGAQIDATMRANEDRAAEGPAMGQCLAPLDRNTGVWIGAA